MLPVPLGCLGIGFAVAGHGRPRWGRAHERNAGWRQQSAANSPDSRVYALRLPIVEQRFGDVHLRHLVLEQQQRLRTLGLQLLTRMRRSRSRAAGALRSRGNRSIFMRNRSSCDSGTGNVPICSPDCVSRSRRRRAGLRRALAVMRSSIASSRALCAFGVARLISSASSSFENTGPLWNSNGCCRDGKPNADDVRRQQVARELNALVAQAQRFASACASVVLPTPGTSSINNARGRQTGYAQAQSRLAAHNPIRASMTGSINAVWAVGVRAARSVGLAMIEWC